MKCKLLILLFIPLLSFSQLPHFEQHNILKHIRNYEVNVMYQDQDGFLWFGTSDGLVVFEGKEIELFTKKDSLRDNAVTAIVQDTLGTLWIGHDNGEITLIKNRQIIPFETDAGFPAQPISCFFVDHNNTIWFGTQGEGVYYYDYRRMQNLSTDDGLSDNYIYKIHQDATGKIWIATDYGLNIIHPENDSIQHISMKDGLPDNIVKDFYFIENNDVMIGMEDEGLIKYNIINQNFYSSVDWNYGSLNDFILLNDNIWVSTKRKGVIHLSPSNDHYIARQFTSNEGLISNRTSSVFLDREENIWITSKNGVVQNSGGIIEFLDKTDGLTVENIYDFLITKDGTAFICAEAGLFTMQKDRKGKNVIEKCYIDESVDDKTFVDIYEDIEGYVWLGTYGYGVYRIHPDHSSIKNYTTDNGLGNNNVISITGKDSTVLFSTLGGGVSLTHLSNLNKFTKYTVEDGLQSNYVYASFVDSKNRIWIAMDGGLAVLDDQKIQPLELLSILDINEIYGITEDRKGNMWFTTSNQGVLKFDGDTLLLFDKEKGLQSIVYNSIIYDGKDKIILAREEGIEIINIVDESISYYGEEFGMEGFEPVLNAVYQDNDQNIWITGKNAILKYNTQKANKEQVNARILITRKEVNFDPIRDQSSVFNHTENHFTFSYKGLWYKAPDRILYRHKLTNYDIEWSQPNSLQMVTYSNLSPGEYAFEVQVTNESGIWYSSPKAVYHFRIRPPFWQTWWFISITSIALLGLVWFIIVYRTRSLQRAKDELELEVQKRTAKIQSQKEEIEAQRDEIEKKNEDIVDSIQYASRIQNAVQPPKDLLIKVFRDAFILNKPRDIVSGDFYWFSQRDQLIFIAAADCTGHGVPGAFMSMLGVSSLNEIVSSADCQCDSAYILNNLRDKIKSSLHQEGKTGEAKDGMDIAFCIIDLENREINFAGAYNPLYMIRDEELIVYKADKMPIGIHLNDHKKFTNHKIKYQKDDRFYLFSDGYVDQFGGERARKFLTKNFKNLIMEIHKRPFEEQRQVLDDTIEKWKGKHHQVDDMLVIGFKL